MALEYDVYLDSTKLTDLPEGLADLELSIVREGGITSDDQVLRLKSETELTFSGDGYSYICQKKQADFCQDIDVKIYLKCDQYSRLAFIGLLPLIGTQTNPHKKVVTAKIRDNSYSGLIRERQNNKVFLTATKSATGETITSCPSRIIDFFNRSGGFPAGYQQRRVWDVFDVMKWLIKQYTNDSVNVVSDVFSLGGAWYHKYAITMGGMLYGGISWSGQNNLPKYFTPQVSFLEVFREVRKKLRIYMSVDMDVNGVPTLRIEPEAYFFSDTQLFDVGEIPKELVEDYDLEQIYSEVRIGSTNNKVEDGSYYTYPQLLLDSWVQEDYANCSECVEENSLDLVSEWVIDSNVIHFTINQDGSTHPPDSPENVAFGDKVFLIETSNTTDRAEQYGPYGTVDIGGFDFPAYYYNDSLTNRNVFSNWAGGIPDCVAQYIYDLCVDACSSDVGISVPGISITVSNPFELSLSEENCNTYMFTETFDFFFTYLAKTYALNNGLTGSYFIVPADGQYRFIFNSTYAATGSGNAVIQLAIPILEDSTVLTSGGNETSNLLGMYLDQTNVAAPQSGSLSVDTGIINLSKGNVVLFIRYSAFSLYSGTLTYGSPCAQLTEYQIPQSFNFVSDDFLRKPVRWTFPHPVCDTDFINVLADKTGYITVNGQRAWIKQLDYQPDRISNIVLQTNNTICC